MRLVLGFGFERLNVRLQLCVGCVIALPFLGEKYFNFPGFFDVACATTFADLTRDLYSTHRCTMPLGLK